MYAINLAYTRIHNIINNNNNAMHRNMMSHNYCE